MGELDRDFWDDAFAEIQARWTLLIRLLMRS